MNLNLNLYTSLFTKLDIAPSVKYFVSPNVSYDIYPDMRDVQTEYIKDSKLQFIIMSDKTEDFGYFDSLPAMNENYYRTDSISFPDSEKIYLYKRKDR